MTEKSFWVYILASKPGGVLYIGVTSNLIKRIYKHREDLADGFTKDYQVKMLVYFEQHERAETALHRETQMKRWKRDWKVDLIKQHNPGWINLSPSLIAENV